MENKLIYCYHGINSLIDSYLKKKAFGKKLFGKFAAFGSPPLSNFSWTGPVLKATHMLPRWNFLQFDCSSSPVKYLAQQDALEVMLLSQWVVVRRLDWCDSGEWGYQLKTLLMWQVRILMTMKTMMKVKFLKWWKVETQKWKWTKKWSL